MEEPSTEVHQAPPAVRILIKMGLYARESRCSRSCESSEHTFFLNSSRPLEVHERVFLVERKDWYIYVIQHLMRYTMQLYREE